MIQLTDKQVFNLKGSSVVGDVESYPNYFLYSMEFVNSVDKIWFESDPDGLINFNKEKLKWIINNYKTYTFNGNYYDLPILYICLFTNCTTKDLHEATVDIIENNVRPYQLYRRLNINPQAIMKPNHIDLKEVAFGKSSLKTYAGRIHAPYMQDLPYEPTKILTEDEKKDVFTYCWNDTNNTNLLKTYLKKQLDLRITMGKKYACDLRSKSDAQIAEEVISRELLWKYNISAKRPKVDYDLTFKYKAPSNISFKTDNFNDMFDKIKNLDFGFKSNGRLGVIGQTNNIIGHIKQNISTYTVGIGGLHSNEKNISYESNDKVTYIDRDVSSYYPSIILQQKLYPEHLTSAFLSVYKNIVDSRLKAKAEGDKTTADTLKITINGSFGKFGSEYSILFAPKLLIQTTVSGQLYLLMLIEALELAGFTVVSANTDGVVTEVPNDRKQEFDQIVAEWEDITKFDTDETVYSKYYARDVNSYIAVKTDGEVKYKGCFGEGGLSKNPAGRIIYKAVSDYIVDRTPVEKTIENCKDIRDFLFVRNVKGGCVDQNGKNIGKVVRWYQSENQFSPLRYAKNGNKVPKSEGAKEIMDLSQYVVDLPSDIYYDWYSYEARQILNEWGFNLKSAMNPTTGQYELI